MKMGKYLLNILIFLLLLLFANGATLAARYVDNADGTVTDTKTGLMWQWADDGEKRSMNSPNSAADYCEQLSLGDHDDWRLPRIDELTTIIDYSTSHPALDPVFFGRSDWYWSINDAPSAYNPYEPSSWQVYFDTGQVRAYKKTDGFYGRCVRGGPFWTYDITERFSPNTSHTIKDSYYGYIWQRSDDGIGRTWEDAKSYCEQLTLDSFEDWRLPTMEELRTIINFPASPPFVTKWFDGYPWGYWSSTVSAIDPASAWIVAFDFGVQDTRSKNINLNTRCVRSGPGPGEGAALAAGFGSQGLWLYRNAAWSQLTGASSNHMASYGNKLVANFAGYGLYQYNGTTWTQLSSNDSVEDLIGVSGNLYADYGTLGLWKYNGTWTQLTSADPNRLGSYGEKLVANFPCCGLYEYDGSSWTMMTGNSGVTDMIAVDLP